MAEDYYTTLGVARDGSQADIEKAYAKLARKYHPDLNPDDKTAKKKFQAVQAAYDVLKDPAKREMYDRYGSAFEGAGAAGPRPGGARSYTTGPGGEDFDFAQFFGERFGADAAGGFGDLFGQFRRGAAAGGGNAKRRRRPAGRTAGADVTGELPITFPLAVTGGEAHVSLERPGGKVETIGVRIPAGIEDGKVIRLRGQGEPSPDGGAAGDVLLTIRVAPHPWFTRRGDHLHVRLPVSVREAAAGAKIDVPTPKGVVSLRVPAGTSSGTKLRIKGHGIAAQGREPGDLFAEIQIVLPAKLDEKSLQLIAEFDARHRIEPRRELRW